MVEISDTELAFGQCLIGKPKQQSFVLRNPSDLAVRFEVDLPETEAICYEVSPERSILAPGREGVVMITVTAQDVGMHFFPIFVRILGRDSEPPIQVLSPPLPPFPLDDSLHVTTGTLNGNSIPGLGIGTLFHRS